MSADKVLSTNRKNVNVNVAKKTVDWFSQRPNDRIRSVKPGAIRRRVISANQNFNFNKTVQFRLPSVQYLGDMYLRVKVGTPTEDLRARWGASLIESMRIRNSGRLIQEHLDYNCVYKYFQETLDEEKLRQMDKIIGQPNKVAQDCIIPLFGFWTSWCQPNMKRGKPFHMGRLQGNEGLVIELTVNPNQSIFKLDANMANSENLIQSVELVFFEWLTSPALEDAHNAEKYVYHGHDYKIRNNVALVANTEKEIDLTSLTGHTKLYWVSTEDNDNTAQDDKTKNVALDKMALQIDGRQYQSVDTAVENRADALLWGEKGSNEADSGSNYLMLSLSSCKAQTGGLNSQDFKDCKLTLKAPKACQASILALQDVVFTIDQSGSLRRQE